MTLERTATNQSSRSRRSCGESLSHAATQVKTNQENYASSSDPLVGHLNHLTREQAEAFKSFKAEITEKQLYTPAVEGGEKPASHDDATLLYGHSRMLLLLLFLQLWLECWLTVRSVVVSAGGFFARGDSR